ncbi:MAG: octaprenyl diphosphate synthase [Gammaproteobacteria bacterium]
MQGIIVKDMELVKPQEGDFSLKDVRELVRSDWDSVNRKITDSLQSDVALVNSVSRYIINSGGKRLRPLLVLLAARACGYEGDKHIQAAVIIEFIHTATLLHDDVVDESAMRRGHDTANNVFGNQASVLVGDFLYSRSFQLMVRVGHMRIMDVLADATNTIAEGEVLQLMNCNDPETTEQQYMEVIYRKTAKLFEAGMLIGGILAGQTRAVEDALREYGRQLGCAFQLIDDALDYGSSGSDIGKNIGDDLSEGKPTLPLIHALKNADPKEQLIIRKAIEKGGAEQIDSIVKTIRSTGALAYTARRASEAAEKAVEALKEVPDSDYKKALIELARFSVQRQF